MVPAYLPVEGLEPQRLPLPDPRPGGELVPADEETEGREHGDAVQRGHEGERGPRRRVVDGDGAAAPQALSEAVPVGFRSDVRDAVTELGGAVTHRRQDQVGFGPVESAAKRNTARDSVITSGASRRGPPSDGAVNEGPS